MKPRLYYIDYIRLFLCCVVIFHHTAIGFGASGGWYYTSPNRLVDLSALIYSVQMGIDQSYFMSLFFFISALFTPASLDRKGVGAFLKDRFFRLIVPLLIYVFVIHPSLVIYIWGPDAGYHFELGPMWFVFTLILFELTYILTRGLKHNAPTPVINNATMAIFAVVSGLLAFVLRIFIHTNESFMGITLANFVLYIAFYALGIMVARANTLESLSLRRGYLWLGIAFVAWLTMLSVAVSNVEGTSGGLNVVSLAYSLWEAVSCVAVSYLLLALGKAYFNRPNPFWLAMAGDSFLAYVIHPFPVVYFTKLLEGSGLCPELLVPITTVLSIVSTFLMAHIIRFLCHKVNYRWV